MILVPFVLSVVNVRRHARGVERWVLDSLSTVSDPVVARSHDMAVWAVGDARIGTGVTVAHDWRLYPVGHRGVRLAGEPGTGAALHAWRVGAHSVISRP